MPNELLKVSQLSLEIEGREGPIISDLSYSLFEGEILGVLGSSGVGKTLLGLSLLKLLPQGVTMKTGEIQFQDIQIEKASEKELRKIRGKQISMIFQEPRSALNPVLSIGYQIKEQILNHENLSPKEAEEKCFEMLNRVGFPSPRDLSGTYPHELSGGLCQRAMIALALSCQPLLLIADEPTSSLDYSLQNQILELLQNLQQNFKMSLQIVSHDLNVLAQICHRILVLHNGKVCEIGPAKDLFNSPQHPYTKLLVETALKMTKKNGSQRREFPAQNTTDISKIENQDPKPSVPRNIPLLEVKNLTKIFPQNGAGIHKVSFQLHPGETLGILGDSGSGKSTLARTIIRLHEPNSGEVYFNGIDFLTLKGSALRNMRRNIQMIFQDPLASLNPKKTIEQILLEPYEVHKMYSPLIRSEKMKVLLSAVGLSELPLQRFPHELSGGQRQRICIARALSLEPRLLIADEPLSSLDVVTQSQMISLFLDLQKKFQLSILFISHDLVSVKLLCQRVVVMKSGRLTPFQIEEISTASFP